MRSFDLGALSVLRAGTGMHLLFDRLYDASHGNPAIASLPRFSNVPFIPASDPRWTYNVVPGSGAVNGWSNGATTTPNNQATFIYIGIACEVWLRAGSDSGIAFISMDGVPWLAQDTFDPVATLTPLLDGQSCFVDIQTPTGGQHVVVVSWTGAVTSRSTSPAPGIAIQGAYVATTEQAGATWTSPVVQSTGMLTPGRTIVPLVDAGATDVEVQWLLATWEEDPAHPVTTGSGATGNTQSPADPSWAITTATDGHDPTKLAIRHDGLGMGYLGLAVLPPGHYCQLTFAIPSGGYMRGLRLYAWDPETDPDRQRYPAIPDDDLALRTYGAQAVAWTIMQRDPMRALLASTSIGSAVGDLLEAHGAEWGVPRPFGVADLLYQQMVRFLSARRSQGATLRFVRQALSLLLPGVPFSVSAIPTSSTSWTLGTSRLGIDTTLGIKTLNAYQAIITIPIRALTMPPQTVQQIMETFRPVGVTITYIWN